MSLTVYLRGRPVRLGAYFSTSWRSKSTLPAILRVRNLPFLTKSDIACGETLRIRAASDWEIQSPEGASFSFVKVLECFKCFGLCFDM
jgi:hypothetical protein